MNNKPALKSDIRIDAEGLWFYRGKEMTRRDIVQFFYQNLIFDESGTYAVRVGQQTYRIEVEDTAFIVWDIRFVTGDDISREYIELLLSDNRTERLDPETVYIAENDIPYCRIRNRLHRARFSKSAYYKLAEHIQYDPQNDRFYLELSGRLYLGTDPIQR